jgi:hypothetical protein
MNGSEGSSALTGAQQQHFEKTTTTMNYESIYPDAPVESSPRENSNNSGTTLKEHDYIGLSEVSSANSSNDKQQQPEKSLRESLDLNESATALCLGLKPTGKSDDQESMTFGNVTDSYRVVLEPAADGSKLDGPVAQDVNENPAKRAAYHHQQQQDARDSVAEPEFAKSFQGGTQRNNAILQEFRKAQAMKAAQHAPHAQVVNPAANVSRPMHRRPQEYEAGQKGKYPTGMHASYNAFPAVKNNGVKRGFSEAVGMNLTGLSGPGGVAREGHGDVNRGEGMCGSEQQDVKVKSQQGGKPWMGAQSFVNKSAAWQNLANPFRRTFLNKNVQDAGDSSNKAANEANKHGLNEAVAPPNDQPPSPVQNQTVGWPPVRNFVRNNNPVRPAPPPSAPVTACPSAQGKGASTSTNTNSLFVKIYMDGVPFGRKVDLRSNNSYDKLYLTLEEMFQQFINGQYGASRTSSSAESHFVSTNRKLNFLDGSEYVLIYEDHEGDFMLVGDVPWELFINAVKRLRIMKGSEEVNLAPKNADPMKTQAAVGGR